MKAAVDDSNQPIRLWPAVLIVAAQMLMIVTQYPFGENKVIHGWIALLIWWLLFSRVAVKQRLIGLAVFVGVGIVPRLLMHRSLDFVIFMYVVPSVTTALVIGWLLAAKAKWNVRRWVGLATATIAFISWTLVRVDGVSGDLSPELALRWSSTQEEAFLVSGPTSVEQPIASTVAETRLGDWPAFRGVARDSVVTEANLNGADLRAWARSQPTPRWRQRVGPAWSSFAIIGDLVMTQEQRGEKEAIVAYHADTGRQVWQHTHQARFDEMLAGVGPRGTPTNANGRLYAVGATGLVSCLEVATGELTWEVDLKQETTSTGPIWGFSCSPLVVGDLLLVHAGGGENDAVIAFQTADGEVRWKQGSGTSYASPHVAVFDDEKQVLILDEYGLESRVPETGDLIWNFDWNATHEQEARIIQPWVGDDGVILLGSESNLIRLKVSQDDGEWTVSEQWRTRDLKPDFNDLVVREGHIYGFDGSVFCCLDLATGKRKWRSRGYGKGQVLLVPSEGLLLVLSEQGEVALLEADSGKRKEIARFPALDGKTWNHPVIANGRLYIRNAAEMACFDLK